MSSDPRTWRTWPEIQADDLTLCNGGSMSDRETARIVICAPATFTKFFPDDLHGCCALCQTVVRFRPHVPDRRVLICLLCFLKHAEPGTRCEVLGEAVDELRAMGVDVPQC